MTTEKDKLPVKSVEIQVLPSLRLLTGIAWFVLSFSLCALLDASTSIDVYSVLLWIFFSVMGLYWQWRGGEKWFREYYLPAGLLLMSVMPILLEGIAIAWLMTVNRPEAAQGLNSIALYVWLIVPLVAVSMRYRYKTLLLFTSGTSIAAYLVGIWARDIFSLPIGERFEIAITRWLLFTISGLVIVQMSNRQRDLRRELLQKNQQLLHYATMREQLTTTRERNRLARELHDTLAHTLSGIDVQLKALDVLMTTDPEAARDMLRQTQTHTRQGLQAARRALHDLRAKPVEELGLRLALQRIAKQAADRAGLELSLHLTADTEGLAPLVEQHLYRIAEEALSNVVRHADATRLQLSLKKQASLLHLTITDNGRGFDSYRTERPGHFGLSGIRERAALIDAQITIQSQPDHGTQIQVNIPCPR